MSISISINWRTANGRFTRLSAWSPLTFHVSSGVAPTASASRPNTESMERRMLELKLSAIQLYSVVVVNCVTRFASDRSFSVWSEWTVWFDCRTVNERQSFATVNVTAVCRRQAIQVRNQFVAVTKSFRGQTYVRPSVMESCDNLSSSTCTLNCLIKRRHD